MPRIRPSRGTHVILSRDDAARSTSGVIVPAGGGRTVFVLPWLGRTLVGHDRQRLRGRARPRARLRATTSTTCSTRSTTSSATSLGPERPDRRLRRRAAADLDRRPEEVGRHLAQGRAVRDELRARHDHRRQAHHLAADGQARRSTGSSSARAARRPAARTRSRSACRRTRPTLPERAGRGRGQPRPPGGPLRARGPRRAEAGGGGAAARGADQPGAARPRGRGRLRASATSRRARSPTCCCAAPGSACSTRARCRRRTPRAPGARRARDGRRARLGRARASSRSCATGPRWRAGARALGCPRRRGARLRCATALEQPERPLLMGIVNATPDSFSDPQGAKSLDELVERAHGLAEDGRRDRSTWAASPGAPTARPSPVEEESARVVPLVERLAADGLRGVGGHLARAGRARGAGRRRGDGQRRERAVRPRRWPTPAPRPAPRWWSPTRARAPKVKAFPDYDDVVADVIALLRERAALAARARGGGGAAVLDPGIDLAKTPAESVEVLRRLPELAELGRPLLLAVSRKDFIGALTGRRPPRATPARSPRSGVAADGGARDPAGARRGRRRATTCAVRARAGRAARRREPAPRPRRCAGSRRD